ncbi:hypothetical protein [Salinicola socius]|uniref:Uncharacterized protein n=1 Tax=Salinicola socius TaxID=404433 RepID=A0A1Q8SPI6_9GAMM|nr:hypothetical protein [Salinicola socius]OLO03331.1 hypothetical protein BTW07_14710 [Salinicola socius]
MGHLDARKVDASLRVQLNLEALRCRVAFESFTNLLAGEFIAKETRGDLYWFVLQQHCVSWVAHLYESLKLCVELDQDLAPGGLKKWIIKQFSIDPKNNHLIAEKVNQMVGEAAQRAFENDEPSRDIEVDWSDSFVASLVKIRNKHFAHPDAERVDLSAMSKFGRNHYYIAFSCYRQCVLPWASLDSMPRDLKVSVDKFKEIILEIPKGRFRST